MKECVECNKKLGIIEGYRHPTMGKDYLLCGNCFDTVSASVDGWSEFILPYVDFFNKETSAIDDIQKIKNNITRGIEKMQNKVNKLWSHKVNQNANETSSIIN